jgi:predicted amidohydrolase
VLDAGPCRVAAATGLERLERGRQPLVDRGRLAPQPLAQVGTAGQLTSPQRARRLARHALHAGAIGPVRIEGAEEPSSAQRDHGLEPFPRRPDRADLIRAFDVQHRCGLTLDEHRVRIAIVTELRNVRVAAIQATPVILDAEASVAKAVRLLEEAAAGGAELAVLPETFIPLYPSNKWARGAAGFAGWDELWERLHANAVDVPGVLVDEIAAACERLGLHVVVGVNEREGGTLYNAYLLIGPEGLLHRHRKLMPTQHERLFHGIGAGDDLAPVDTPVGRVGGLICWENRMPLARWAVYQGTPQIWAAPTADDSDGWQASVRHIAIESGAFVVSVPQYIPGSAFPEDFPVEVDREVVYGRGGAVVVEPTWGEIIAGPLYDAEGIVFADCDLRAGLHAKRWFDAVGHYSRTDVLSPTR